MRFPIEISIRRRSSVGWQQQRVSEISSVFDETATGPATDNFSVRIECVGLLPRAEIANRDRALQPVVGAEQRAITAAQKQRLVDRHVERCPMRGFINYPYQAREHQDSPTETGSTG